MNRVVEFLKKHQNTTVTFEHDKELDVYFVKVRDFNQNKGWSQAFGGIDFEDNLDIIIKYALDIAEKAIYSV